MKKVLVIDDESFIISLFKRFLTHFDVILDTCETSDELDLLLDGKDGEHQLCFLDYHFNEMSAGDIIHKLKKWSPEMECIIMSGDPDNFLDIPRSEVCGTLAKPFSLDLIKEILEKKGIHKK